MKNTLISASVALILSGLSYTANATNLLEAYQDAVKNDPQTLKAKSQYDIARESENIAFSSLLPTVGFSAGYTVAGGDDYSFDTMQQYSYDTNSIEYGITLSQTIFKMCDWYNLDSSEKKALQAQAGYDLAQQGLIVRVANAYFNVLKAQDNLEFVNAEKKSHRTSIRTN
jgi:outer membrane protein